LPIAHSQKYYEIIKMGVRFPHHPLYMGGMGYWFARQSFEIGLVAFWFGW